jgi:hypothetical protein
VRSGRRQHRAWAAWLGLLALALNALVPVHLAFDLAEALAPAPRHGAPAAAHSAEWRLLALLTGHREADGKSREHGKERRTDCPVCNALGTLVGVAPVAIAALPVPAPVAMPALPESVEFIAATPTAAYRPRAPPAV